jgi:hypothetical protein
VEALNTKAFAGSYLSCRNSLATVSPLELLVYR